MTGVVELLASAGESAPVQRVRNYHLSDRAASPRPRDFLTAMRRTGGAVCVRVADPSGVRFARFAGSDPDSDADWELAAPDSPRARATVEAVDAERVRRLLREGHPELVAREAVRTAFEASDSSAGAVTDGGLRTEAGEEPVRVGGYADLLGDPALDRADAEALAGALPTAPGEVAFRLPRALAAEVVLRSVDGSDRVFVAERVPDRETVGSHYVRQGRRGCRVPKAEVRRYELADGASASERPESA